ncbi:MAG: glycosyltransferase family 1 protein [Anaerolineae bacterium]|nr:glycosyltransferase family 1 protein [Anaerolineae bacterium]
MRIVIPTIGSRGDVQPFLALGQGLIQAGHTVTLASLSVMKMLVESHGVPFAPIGPDIDLEEEVAAVRRQSRHAAVGLVRAMRFSFDILERSHADILALCREADLVVVPAQSAAGKNEADLLDLPYLSVNYVPWGIPWDDPGRPWTKRLAYGAIDGLIGLITTRPLNRVRKQQGLPPVGPEGFGSPRLNLVPVSPAVYPPNPHWAPHHHMVGYWFAQEPAGWQPAPNLLAFLEDGEPPLVVSLGAMSLGKEGAFASATLFVKAIRQVGSRAIVQGWEEGLKQLSLPPDIYPAGSLPYNWLLPRCAGLVHHGGMGTTSAGLRAGLPALVIPHLVDQFYWGQRVHELGAGPPPIRHTRLDASSLVAGLEELTRNPALRAAASALGEQIRTERGVKNGVRLIEETFGS